MIKLWHDDTRSAPDDTWVWAQNNDQAREILQSGMVTEISMDHDLGAKPGQIWAAGGAEDNGLVLATWMVEHNLVPEKVTIHSWNPGGARAMAQVIAGSGRDVVIAPYQIPGTFVF